MTNTNTESKSVGEIILAVYEHNTGFINPSIISDIRAGVIESENKDLFIVSRLSEIDSKKFDTVIDFCIKQGLFTTDQLLDAQQATASSSTIAEPQEGESAKAIDVDSEILADRIDVSNEIPESIDAEDSVAAVADEDTPRIENTIGPVPEELSNKSPEKPKKDRVGKGRKAKPDDVSDDHWEIYEAARSRQELFSEREIQDLVDKGVNLYKAIPGNLISKDSNIVYARTQLRRFIDSKASDFILRTQKKDSKVWYQIWFRINGEWETQDESAPDHFKSENQQTENFFFSTVRKYIGSLAKDFTPDLKHVAQDGRFSLEYRDQMRDFRLSAAPAQCFDEYFPQYCLRLTSQADDIHFDDLFILPFMRKIFRKSIDNRIAGLILLTGPTGAGKSTTWYAMVNEIDKDKNNIMSIEKPIEAMVYGVQQTGEDTKERADARNTYRIIDGIRCGLRQALDLLVVGEMRDKKETAETTNAGLVGNKVITTYHTNSAVDTILRMMEEEVSRNKIANGVKTIYAQRLVKRLCPHCSLSDDEAKAIETKIRKSFGVSQRNLQSSLSDVLMAIPDGRFNLDDLEIELERRLKFISSDDADAIIASVLRKGESFNELTRDEKTKIILEAALPYPNSEVREFFEGLMEKRDIRKRNPEGCSHPNCRSGYSDRIGIYEALEFDRAIKKFIQDPEKPITDMEDFIIDKGFVNMKMYGYLLTLMGVVSYEDILDAVD